MAQGWSESPLTGRMVFLVGARRSGTNWVHRMLGVHPDVAVVPGETHLFSHGIAPLVERFHHGPLGSPRTGFVHMDRDDLHTACRSFCDRVFLPYLEGSPGATVLVERTPWHVEHLDLIGSVYPDAKVVHLVRDGRDVARSLLAQGWVATAPDGLADAASEWRRAVIAARAAAPGLTYLEVRYEELLADPRGSVADLYGWLGLPVDDDVTSAALAEAGARFNVDPTMPQLTAEKWRSALSPEQIACIEEAAADALDALGYARADTGSDGRARTDADPAPGPATAHRRRSRGSTRFARVRRLVRWLCRRPVAPSGGAPLDMESIAQVVDDFLEAVHTGSVDGMAAHAAFDVSVRIVDRGHGWAGRGEEGLHRLAAVTAEHGLPVARQRRGDVHPGATGFTVVLGYDGDAGPFDVVFVLAVEHLRLRYITYYRLPLDGTGPAS